MSSEDGNLALTLNNGHEIRAYEVINGNFTVRESLFMRQGALFVNGVPYSGGVYDNGQFRFKIMRQTKSRIELAIPKSVDRIVIRGAFEVETDIRKLFDTIPEPEQLTVHEFLLCIFGERAATAVVRSHFGIEHRMTDTIYRSERLMKWALLSLQSLALPVDDGSENVNAIVKLWDVVMSGKKIVPGGDPIG